MNAQIKKVRRETELENIRRYGPKHGRAGTQRSKRDKALCPKRQRKQKDWD